MKYKLEIKKPKSGPNKNDIILTMTDVQFHTARKRPSSFSKTIEESVENKKPSRIYRNIEKTKKDELILDLIKEDPDFKALIRKYEKQGKRVFIQVPKKLFTFPGKDTMEFIDSKNGKRIVRKFEKKYKN